MSIKKLTAENAIIKTAAVEVKTLTISGKQVTLAVFRQLPNESCFGFGNENEDDEIFLKGPIWGRVNYHPDKSCDEFANRHHTHVIWQDGPVLKRSLVAAPYVAASPHLCAKYAYVGFAYVEPTRTNPHEDHIYRPDCPVFFTTVELLASYHRGDLAFEELSEWAKAYRKVYDIIMQSDQLYIAI